jgi:DNA-directed RNA polymerase II subunit RPB1
MDLSEPVFHLGFYDTIISVLRCVCIRCSKLLIYKNEDELIELLKSKKGKSRITELKNMVKNITYCQKANYGCGAPVAKIKPDKKKSTAEINIVAEYQTLNSTEDNPDKKPIREILTPSMVYNILKNISNQDCKIIGIDPIKNRPENMIHVTFPVPPVQVRPSVRGDLFASTTREDHLTIKLSDILKANIRIQKHKENMNENTIKYFQDHVSYLQYHVATYFDNESITLPQSEQKGVVTKSLASRLKGKEGRIRNNLMGKRTDFSARTVITPDPTLSINELGVPITIAKNITFPEIVTPHNIDYLSNLVRNGRDKYPGANFVLPATMNESETKTQIDLRWRKEKIELRYGDIVERHIKNGDIVLLNRQPTLHKQSMMGHRIKVIDNPNYSTFRLNPNVTTPYNADFDGDEMNIFCPQSLEAQIELEEIADVKLQIITPQSSAPIIGILQDGILGAYNLTSPNSMIDWRTTMNIMTATDIDKLDLFKKDKDYTGKEIYTYLIPKKINLFKGDEKNVKISIKNGKMEAGTLGIASLGVKVKNNLIQLIWDEYGVEKTRKFIDNTTRIVNNFNLYHGFTVGIGDLEIGDHLYGVIQQIIETKKLEVEHEITEYESNPDIMDSELFERLVKQKLNNIRDDVSKLIIANCKSTNNFKIMIESGSKGKAINLGQMCGCVGQQDYEGNRIHKNFNGRTLPYFFKNDDRAEARGFVEKSFMDGLNLTEFIFHHLTSREGLINQTIKTAESGYIQRKLIKSTEDFIVKYDGTVRNAVERIQQFIYGDSGVDTVKQYEYKFKMMEMSNDQMKEVFKFTKEELEKLKFSNNDNEILFQKMLDMRDNLRRTQQKATANYLLLSTSYMLPININRIIDNIRNNNNSSKEVPTVSYILDMIENVLKNNKTLLYCMTAEEMNNSSSVKYTDDKISKTAIKYALYESLHPKKVLCDYKLNKTQIDQIGEMIISSFNKAIVEPGEMVGILGAQSIGEPVTQLMLNAFHTAGVGGMGGVNTGVGRIKEVIHLSKNPKEPVMVIYLEKEHNKKKDYANKIASYIKFTTIKDLRKKIEIFYDPNPTEANSFMEKDNVNNIFHTYQQSKTCCSNTIDGLNWLMRIEFDKEKLMNKEVSLLDIKSQFCFSWDKRYQDIKNIKREKRQIIEKITQLAVLSNSDNDNVPVIHIRFDMTNFNSATLVDFMDIFIDEFKLKGMPNIEDVRGGGYALEERKISFDTPDKSIDKSNEYVIYTKGINMHAIRNITGVDLTRTYCNDIITTYEIFGIEAARKLIIKEITSVFEGDGSGSSVNFQHISIYGDLITNIGTLTSIDRHGLNKLDTDPLSRASFEKTVDQLITAAIFNETDYMKSVSSRIMAGLCIKGGTGLCNLVLDKELLENSEYTTDIGQLYKKTYNDITSTQDKQEIDEDVFIPEL